MHSPIAVKSKYNCDSRANYWQQLSLLLSLSPFLSISLSLLLTLSSLRHKSPRPLPRAAFNYAGRPNAVEGFICAQLQLGDEQLHSISLSLPITPTSLSLGAIGDLPRNVAVTRAALAAFQLRRSSNLLIDK